MVGQHVTGWPGLGAAVVLLVSVGYLTLHLAPADDASAKAGREYGRSQAEMYRRLSTEPPSDEQIRAWCETGAQLSAESPVWHRSGVIRVGELDRDRFAEGCFETYRAATR